MATTDTSPLLNHVLANLFKDTFLVDLNETAGATLTNSNPTEQVKREVLICIATFENKLKPEKEALLNAILSACKLDPTQLLICTDQEQLHSSFLSIVEAHQANKVILFGLDPAHIGLPIHFPLFQIQSFQGVQYLHAPSLDALEIDKQMKMQLWQKLKQIFPS
jgi:DNA polymerase III psi subunit